MEGKAFHACDYIRYYANIECWIREGIPKEHDLIFSDSGSGRDGFGSSQVETADSDSGAQ